MLNNETSPKDLDRAFAIPTLLLLLKFITHTTHTGAFPENDLRRGLNPLCTSFQLDGHAKVGLTWISISLD